MTAYQLTDPEARFLYEKAGFAAYCAYRRLQLEPDQNFEDARQEAVLTFWDTYRAKGDERYAFVAARNAVLESLVRHKNPYAVSLDAAGDDDDIPWLERLAVPGSDTGWHESDWLSDADLEGLVTELFTVPATREALDGYRRLLRYQLTKSPTERSEGCSLEETAQRLGWTYNATKALLRRLIGKLAEHYDVAPTWPAVFARLRQEKDLDGVLLAATSQPPGTHTVTYNARILRLLMQGYDSAGVAVELDKKESAIKDARKKLKAKLVEYCQQKGIEPPQYNRNGGGWRPAHHYGNHHGRPGKAA